MASPIPHTYARAGAKIDRKSTRLNSSHEWISYAVFCWKKKDTQGRELSTCLQHRFISAVERLLRFSLFALSSFSSMLLVPLTFAMELRSGGSLINRR